MTGWEGSALERSGSQKTGLPPATSFSGVGEETLRRECDPGRVDSSGISSELS
jgi:hypothetical protein